MNLNLYELSAADKIEPMKLKLNKAIIENNISNQLLPLTKNEQLAYQHHDLNEIKHNEAKNLKEIYNLDEHETKTIDTMINDGLSIVKIYNKIISIQNLILNYVDINTIDLTESIEDIILKHKPDNIRILLSGRCVEIGSDTK